MGPDLHQRHGGGPEGGHLLAAPDPGDRQPDGPDDGHRSRRRGLRVDAAVPLQLGDGGVGPVGGGRGRRWAWPGSSPRRAGCRTCAATGPRTSTTRASRWPTSWPSPSDPTTPTTRCGWPTGTKVRPRSSRPSPSGSGVRVIDAFGATEGGLAVTRVDDAPPGSVGKAGPELRIVSEDGEELPRATFDAAGTLVDPVDCVGEIVNTSGIGVFEGYYNNDEANARATRNGWYWSGDLGYLDEAGLPLLRRAQRRLDPGGRGELPGGPHRDGGGPPPRRAGLRRLRRPRPRGRATGSWSAWCCGTAPSSTRRPSPPGSTGRRT